MSRRSSDRFSDGDNFSNYPRQNALPNPLSVANDTLQELEDAKAQGLFGLMRMRWDAWLEERLAGPILRKMKTRQKLLDGKRELIQTGMNLVNQQEKAQREVELHRIEYVQVQQKRLLVESGEYPSMLLPSPQMPASASAPVPPSEPPLRPYLTDEQLDALAQRFLAQFGHGEDFAVAWNRFYREAQPVLPDQVIIEVRQRVEALLSQRR